MGHWPVVSSRYAPLLNSVNSLRPGEKWPLIWLRHVFFRVWTDAEHFSGVFSLTHWHRVTHICVGKLTIIGSDNGLSPGRRQAIIWTNAEILLIRPLGTNFSEILIGIQTFSFKKMYLKMSSAKWRRFGLDLNVLIYATWIDLAMPFSKPMLTNIVASLCHWDNCPLENGKYFSDDILNEFPLMKI